MFFVPDAQDFIQNNQRCELGLGKASENIEPKMSASLHAAGKLQEVGLSPGIGPETGSKALDWLNSLKEKSKRKAQCIVEEC